MTRSCVRHYLFACDRTHRCVWHDSLMWMPWLTHMSNMTHSRRYQDISSRTKTVTQSHSKKYRDPPLDARVTVHTVDNHAVRSTGILLLMSVRRTHVHCVWLLCDVLTCIACDSCACDCTHCWCARILIHVNESGHQQSLPGSWYVVLRYRMVFWIVA